MSAVPTCAHCQETIEGPPATIWRGGPTHYLHHEDGHLDCYHVVTVYRHPMPCRWCDPQEAHA